MRNWLERTWWSVLFASLLPMVLCSSALASDIPLDPSFSTDGREFVAPYGSFSSDVFVRGGQIYSIGRDFFEEDPPLTFVTRTNADGNPDLSFDEDGRQSIVPRVGRCSWSGVTLDASDRVVGVTACRRGMTVFRLTTSGAIDTTFAGDGIKFLAGQSEGSARFPQIAVDGAGRIVVAGIVDSGGAADSRIWRLEDSGAADASFSGDGTRLVRRPGLDWISALAVDAVGRILVAQGPDFQSSSLYRLTTTGRLDPSFAQEGVKRIRFGDRDVGVLALEGTADGRITLAVGIGHSQGAMRLRASGALDRTFGDQGVIRVPCGCYVNAGDVVDGRVVVGGSLENGDYRLTWFSSNANHIRVASGNVYPDRKGEGVLAVTLAGRKVLLTGQARTTAFVARVE